MVVPLQLATCRPRVSRSRSSILLFILIHKLQTICCHSFRAGSGDIDVTLLNFGESGLFKNEWPAWPGSQRPAGLPVGIRHSQSARPPPCGAPSGATAAGRRSGSHASAPTAPPPTSLFADHSAEPRSGGDAMTCLQQVVVFLHLTFSRGSHVVVAGEILCTILAENQPRKPVLA